MGEVREGQKERAEGMCGSQEATKEISSPSFQSSARRKRGEKAGAEMKQTKQLNLKKNVVAGECLRGRMFSA